MPYDNDKNGLARAGTSPNRAFDRECKTVSGMCGMLGKGPGVLHLVQCAMGEAVGRGKADLGESRKDGISVRNVSLRAKSTGMKSLLKSAADAILDR